MAALEQGVGNADGRAKRLRPHMHCYWGPTESCPRNGSVTSLGPSGCFVKTKAEVTDRQSVYINLWLPTERWLTLRGQVTYSLPRVGFGLSFVDLPEAQREVLRLLLDFIEGSQSQHA